MSLAIEIAKPLVKKWEGCKLTAYRCPAGIWTIGYGSTENVTPGMTITQVKAEARLLHDLKMAEQVVEDNTRGLNENQRAALISFVFNVGRRNFLKSTMLRRISNKQLSLAADEFERWTYADNPRTGKKEKLAGLISRRAEERALFMAPPS